MGGVEFEEALAIRVGAFLRSLGFIPADAFGVAQKVLEESDSLDILYKDPEAKPWWIGTIWFRNSTRGANDDHWVIEVSGRRYYCGLIRQLAEKLAWKFNVEITIRLISEQPQLGTLPDSHGC
ncbi:hypothetical protein J7M23_02005 [Candidatus Sumerlaeota bacterium]|nr:hypothetical protein [Candidatus Sumerlaeota bacterium]